MPTTTVEETEKKETSEDKKSGLLLDSLEIKGYRCFEHLTIGKLGRVNLIVGKNNVGKTALLEALWIYANRGNLNLLFNLIDLREEVPTSGMVFGAENFSYTSRDVRHLFYNRPHVNSLPLFSISSAQGKHELSVKVEKNKTLKTKFEGNELYHIPLIRKNDEIPLTNGDSVNSLINYFINITGLSTAKMAILWDRIALTELEDSVVESINLIPSSVTNSVTKLSFINNSNFLEDFHRTNGTIQRIAVVKTENFEQPVSIKSLGEGMNRLLGISLALANCHNGILLVDEIESGLHYSVLPDVWKLIFKTAKELNVQVFATTHSKDCIEAFAQAAYDSPEEGMLIRLERHGEKIVAKTIEEDMLVDAVNYEVEVR
jgi:AAA15 family ATPase/GTPase